MNEDKDPHQKNGPIDSDGDDEIIELTQMVAITPKDDAEIDDTEAIETAAFQKAAQLPVKTDKIELEADDVADLSDSDESPVSESQAGERLFDPSELDFDDAGSTAELEADDVADLSDSDESPVSESQAGERLFDPSELDFDDAGSTAEDDIIASQIEASLGDDDDDRQDDPIGRTDETDPFFEQDDDLILDTEDKNTAALPDPGGPVAEKNKTVFDGEEEIELEYESDEDEYDFFALDDQKTFQEPETIAMPDEEHDDPMDESILFDPVENLEHSSDDGNEVLAMDADPQEGADLIALDDEDDFVFGKSDELPDLIDEMEFEFDAPDDENGLDTAGDQPAEDSDDIIARTVEKSLAPGEVTAQVDLAMVPEFEFTEDGDIVAEDDQQATPEDLTETTMEEIRLLAEEDYLPEIDDELELEFEDDEGEAGIDEIDELELEDALLPLEDFDESAAGEEDDIIEITEFDHHFPEEDENMVELSSILETAETDEDGDLELIEVEEDDPADDENAADFRYSAEDNDEEDIDRFFSETLGNEPVLENEETEAVEEIPTLSTDMAMATTLTEEEGEEFDFRLDPGEISDQVDRLDAFLSDDSTPAPEIGALSEAPEIGALSEEPEIGALSEEPEVAALFEEPSAEEETADDHQAAIEQTIKSMSVTPDQIDSILERVIRDKLGGKIEGIIYEVIEKAVSKEIDRLKGALLDNAGPGDIEEK